MKTRVSMTTPVIVLTALALLGGCSSARLVNPDLPPTALSTDAARITDAVIRADRDYLAALQERLRVVNANGVAVDNYHFCKAQAWLDLASNEYNDNDRSGVVEAALTEAVTLLDQLEDRATDISMATPVIATSRKMRDDLWSFAAERKTQKIQSCGACDLAKMEVQLVWIGHEHNELGWRHALSAVAAAERLQRAVVRDGENCAAMASRVTPAVPVVEAVSPKADIQLPRYVHFALRQASISGESLAVIRTVAATLQDHPDLELRLVGHTDVRGMSGYNRKLAANRARAVLQALISEGIASDRLTTAVAGPFQPRVLDSTVRSHAQNRRVEIVIASGQPVDLVLQERDLQLESAAR